MRLAAPGWNFHRKLTCALHSHDSQLVGLPVRFLNPELWIRKEGKIWFTFVGTADSQFLDLFVRLVWLRVVIKSSRNQNASISTCTLMSLLVGKCWYSPRSLNMELLEVPTWSSQLDSKVKVIGKYCHTLHCPLIWRLFIRWILAIFIWDCLSSQRQKNHTIHIPCLVRHICKLGVLVNFLASGGVGGQLHKSELDFKIVKTRAVVSTSYLWLYLGLSSTCPIDTGFGLRPNSMLWTQTYQQLASQVWKPNYTLYNICSKLHLPCSTRSVWRVVWVPMLGHQGSQQMIVHPP